MAEGSVTEDDTCSSSVDAASVSSAAANRLFALQVVNSYGSTEVDRLVDDGKPLNLDGKFIFHTRIIFGFHQTKIPFLRFNLKKLSFI